VVIGNDKFDAPEAAIGQRAQEPLPEGFGLGGSGADAQHLTSAIVADTDGYYRRGRHNPTALARLDVRRIEPQIWKFTLDRSVEKGVHPLVDLLDQSADGALGNACSAHGLHKVIHRSGRNALDIGFLDHCGQRLLGSAAGFKEGWEIRSLAQPWDLQSDMAGSRLPGALPITVALNLPPGRIASPMCGAG